MKIRGSVVSYVKLYFSPSAGGLKKKKKKRQQPSCCGHPLPHRSSSKQQVRGINRRCSYQTLGGLVNETADVVPDIKRRVRLAWACFDRFKLELCDMETASFTLKVCVLKSEVMETLRYGCVAWTLGVEHIAVLQSSHGRLLLRIIGFHRRQRTDHRMSYARTLKKARCESVEKTIRKMASPSRGGRPAGKT